MPRHGRRSRAGSLSSQGVQAGTRRGQNCGASPGGPGADVGAPGLRGDASVPFEPLTLSTGRSSTEAATDGPEVEGGSSRLNRGSGNGKEEIRWTQAVRTQHRGDSGLTGCLGPWRTSPAPSTGLGTASAEHSWERGLSRRAGRKAGLHQPRPGTESLGRAPFLGLMRAGLDFFHGGPDGDGTLGTQDPSLTFHLTPQSQVNLTTPHSPHVGLHTCFPQDTTRNPRPLATKGSILIKIHIKYKSPD